MVMPRCGCVHPGGSRSCGARADCLLQRRCRGRHALEVQADTAQREGTPQAVVLHSGSPKLLIFDNS
jgi:hypothetical protein